MIDPSIIQQEPGAALPAGRKYAMISFGCQMNVSDSEFIDGVMQARGWQATEELEECDLILMNTCVVRNTAENRAKARLETFKPLKKKNPELVIGVCGCLAQKDGRQLLEDFPQVDMVIGTRELWKAGHLVDEVRLTGERYVMVEDIDQPAAIHAAPLRQDDLKAFITIMYGCNNDCTFCIVPKTRGREWSRPAQSIADEVRQLIDRGYKEVTLLGQNVNSYHDGQYDFAELLELLDATGIERLRFTTSNPQDTTDKLLDAFAGLRSVCKHYHLPAQAGSNRILKLMDRRYTAERYLEILDGMRRRAPGVAITTDIIVGFPGELEADFAQTLELARQARWDSAFTFIYSPRTDTPAAALPDPVPLEEKKKWLKELIGVCERIGAEINQALVGRQERILIEGPSRRGAAQMMGRSGGNKIVILNDSAARRGELLDAEITAGHAHTLFGRILN